MTKGKHGAFAMPAWDLKDPVEGWVKQDGLTKREYFAAKNLQGLIAGYPNEAKVHGWYIANSDYADLAKEAVELADALIEQLNK